MLTRDKTRLEVVENFQIDWQLPKFRKKMSKVAPGTGQKADHIEVLDLTEVDSESSDDKEDDDDFGQTFRMSSRNIVMNSTWGIQEVKLERAEPPWWKFWAKKPARVTEPEPTMSIEEFFASIKNTSQELVIVKERAHGYERALDNAKKTGQLALLEQLKSGINAYKMETQLVALGMTKYVEEQAIIAFYKQCKKGLRLDWVKNFVRTIPEEIAAKKAHADELGIFDNYVVLHYDPQAKSFAETEKEKEARKDPILFGMMKNRTQLYFIGDWIDEYCDLTLDQIAETLGADVVKSVTPPEHPYREAT